MAAHVVMYSWIVCPYCVRAKRLLKEKGVEVEEILLDGKDDELNALRARTGWKTVPQIFIDGEFVGGYDDILQLDRAGELDPKLKLDR